MNQHITLYSRDTVALERIASDLHLDINAFGEPSIPRGEDDFAPLPPGTRVVTLDRCGTIARDWKWSDDIYWPDVFAWAVQDQKSDLFICVNCGDLCDIEEAGLWGHCVDCNADADEGDAEDCENPRSEAKAAIKS